VNRPLVDYTYARAGGHCSQGRDSSATRRPTAAPSGAGGCVRQIRRLDGGRLLRLRFLANTTQNEATLAILADLGKSARLPARAAVPHGLETLARETPQESVRGLAINQLQELQKSDSEAVRQEALISLKKLCQ
jgi:hypothetical protein